MLQASKAPQALAGARHRPTQRSRLSQHLASTCVVARAQHALFLSTVVSVLRRVKVMKHCVASRVRLMQQQLRQK
jgi:hypothetical protein